MRMLASIALSFAAAVFAAVLLPWSGWTWWAAAAAGALGLLAVFLRRHLPEKLRLRAAVMLFSLCAGLVYYGGIWTGCGAPKRFAMGTRPWRLWSRDRELPAGPNGRMRAASMKTT